MQEYADEAINALDKSLRATNVLSDDYRRSIMLYVLTGLAQAYERGRVAEREANHDAYQG